MPILRLSTIPVACSLGNLGIRIEMWDGSDFRKEQEEGLQTSNLKQKSRISSVENRRFKLKLDRYDLMLHRIATIINIFLCLPKETSLKFQIFYKNKN